MASVQEIPRSPSKTTNAANISSMGNAIPTSGPGSGSAGNNKTGRKSASLPTETVEYLKAWMMSPEHISHPYPTEQEKAQIMAETGIELKQLTNWFVNNRKRYWKPRVEAKLQQKVVEGANGLTLAGVGSVTGISGVSGIVTTIANAGMAGNSIASTADAAATAASIARASSSDGLKMLDMTQPQSSMDVPFLPSSLPINLPMNLPSMAEDGSQQVLSGGNAQDPHNSLNNARQNGMPIQHLIHAEDPHTISEGSASSTCNSDDDSIDANSLSITNKRRLSQVSQQSLGSSTKVGGATLRREEVDVHVLRPESSTANSTGEVLPTIRDLTIKTNVPKERILATFPKCQISYTVPFEIEGDRKRVQTRRDGEVLRVKKHYLKLFLATRGIHSVASPLAETVAELNSTFAPVEPAVQSVVSTDAAEALAQLNTAAVIHAPNTVSPMASEPSSSTPSLQVVEPAQTTTTIADCAISTNAFDASRVRSFTCTELDQEQKDEPNRKRARTDSGMTHGDQEWKLACLNAKSVFCETLPGLEEAAILFGFARS